MQSFFRLLTELSSRKTISGMVGSLARSRWSRRWIGHFVRSYGISVEEAEKPLHEYESLNEFFTRRLKPGARPIDPGAHTLTSPVDAVITGLGPIREGLRFEVKGQEYTVGELLNESPRTVNYDNGYFFVLYLSPRDYHRIHAPVSGRIEEKEHIPGKVYPVNDFGLRVMRRVLSRNERLVTYIRHEHGEVAVVKVGALNVSSIRYAEGLADRVDKGDELAMFEFGSTVVLLTESGTFRPRGDLSCGQAVRVGEALGDLKAKHEDGR